MGIFDKQISFITSITFNRPVYKMSIGVCSGLYSSRNSMKNKEMTYPHSQRQTPNVTPSKYCRPSYSYRRPFVFQHCYSAQIPSHFTETTDKMKVKAAIPSKHGWLFKGI